MHARQVVKLFEAYEGENQLCYEENATEKLIMTELKKDPQMVVAIDSLRDRLANPFDWMYYWCKGEIYDIKSLVEAGAQRDLIDKQLKKSRQKKID